MRGAQRSIRREHVYSIETFASPTGGGPDIPVHIAANSVRCTRSEIRKHAPVLQPHTILHVIHANRMRISTIFRRAGVYDIEFFLIRREADPVRLIQIAGHHSYFPRIRIQAINVCR